MKSLAAILVLIVVVISCVDKKRPPQYLSQNTMREVMWDLIRADQYVSDFVLKDSTKNKKDESLRLYEQIFQMHHVTREQFKKSYDYYTSRPDLFRPIIDSLARNKTQYTPFFGHPATRVNKDSIMKATRDKHHPAQ